MNFFIISFFGSSFLRIILIIVSKFLYISGTYDLAKCEKAISICFPDIKTHPIDLFLNIGANIGSVSLPLAKLFNSSTIISVEPTYYAFSKLKKNLNLNPNFKKRIRIYNSFISNKKRKINFIHSSWNFSSGSKKHKVHRGILKQASNKTQSLSELIKKQKRKIDLIKIDVDGYEIDVLRSGKEIINKSTTKRFL